MLRDSAPTTASFATRRALIQGARFWLVWALHACGRRRALDAGRCSTCCPSATWRRAAGGRRWIHAANGVLQDLGGALGRRVSALSVPSLRAMERAIDAGRHRLSGQAGAERRAARAHAGGGVRRRGAGERPPENLLLMRKAPPLDSLRSAGGPGARLASRRGARWCRATSCRSCSSLPAARHRHRTRFAGELVGYLENALAVANGDADVATNNSTDLGIASSSRSGGAPGKVVWRSRPRPRRKSSCAPVGALPQERRLQDFRWPTAAAAMRTVPRSCGAQGGARQRIQGYALADSSVLVQAARR